LQLIGLGKHPTTDPEGSTTSEQAKPVRIVIITLQYTTPTIVVTIAVHMDQPESRRLAPPTTTNSTTRLDGDDRSHL